MFIVRVNPFENFLGLPFSQVGRFSWFVSNSHLVIHCSGTIRSQPLKLQLFLMEYQLLVLSFTASTSPEVLIRVVVSGTQTA